MTVHWRRTSGLTRRDALKLAGAAGAAAGLGFGGGARARQATPAGERPTLRVAVTGIAESLDPHRDFRNQRGVVMYSVFDGLIARDFLAGDPVGTGSGLAPGLATAWRRVDDLTLELTLRDGVTFHNGDPLTAEEVKFSLERVLGSDENPQAKLTLGDITAVEAVDPLRVRLTTAAPDPILEKRLPTNPGWIVSRRAVAEAGPDGFGLKPSGTGPYKVVDYRPDDALILEAHDAYWGGRPPAARIEIRIIPEVGARVAAILSGEVDLINDLPPDQVAAIENEADIEVRGVPVTNLRLLMYNTRLPVMADRRLRQALDLAIDRDLLVSALWGGRALVPRGYQFEDWGRLYNPNRPFPAYDPERARQLVAEAGYAGETIEFWALSGAYTLADEEAQAVVEMWRTVGITAEIRPMTLAEFWDNADQKMVMQTTNNNEFGDPEAWWVRWGEGANPSRLLWTPEDPNFYELGHRARATLDTETRYSAYQEMLDIWEEEMPGSVLCVPIENFAVRSDIDWQPYGYYYMDFRPHNLSFR